jgi:predicted Zn-dependent protease
MGCQSLPPHEQAKQQADERWRDVRARVKLQLGKQQFDGGLFDEAVATLTEAISLNPKDVAPYELLAQSHLERGKPASAEQVIQTATATGLNSADLRYSQGVILEQRNRIEEALVEYARARELDPGKLDYLVAQAECLVESDRAVEALRKLEENADRFDDNATVAALAGQVAASLGDTDKAARYLARARLSAGDDPRTTESLALILADEGRCEQAVPMLREVLDASPTAGAVRRALGRCLLANGDPGAAIAALTDYVQAHPREAQSGVTLAQAYVEVGDLAAAGRTLDRLNRPDDTRVQLTSAAILWKQQKYMPAADLLYALLERDPGNSPALHLLASILRAQNEPDAADNCLARAAAAEATRPR